MGNAGVFVAILLVVTWTAQMILSMLQARRYFKGVNALRHYGRVATGMGGGRYRGRVYGVLAVEPDTRVVAKAAQLSGITVFAGLKPVPTLEGRSLESVLDDSYVLAALPPKAAAAFRAAAQTLRDSFQSSQFSKGVTTSTARKSTAAVRLKRTPAVRPATAKVKE